MAGTPKPMDEIKQILRQLQQGISNSAISRGMGVSRNTIKSYRTKAHNTGLSIDELLVMHDQELASVLRFQDMPVKRNSRHIGLQDNLKDITKELSRHGVTRWLLWQEYRSREPEGYSYSQFCWHLQQHIKWSKSSSIETHLPGDKLFVDFAGKVMSYIDPDSGEIIPAPVFVGQLGLSKYSYIEATAAQDTPSVVNAMNNCIEYLGGVPLCLVPDNMKTAVIKADRFEPELNQILNDFCNHYGMALFPARVRKPKDKALAEQLVNHFYQQVLAPLRNRTFYSLAELNVAIREQLEQYNSRLFQGFDYSRRDRFESMEKDALQALPPVRFEIKKMRDLTVRNNCCVELRENRNYYSVPHQYIGRKVRMIYTLNRVEIYWQGKQIAVHLRSYKPGDYVYVKEHLASHLQQWHNRSAEYYLERAQTHDKTVQQVIARLLEQAPHPELAYRSCEGVLQLSRQATAEKLQKACSIALEINSVHYSTIKRLINSPSLDHPVSVAPKAVAAQSGRGAQYYLNLFNQFLTTIFTL